MQLYQGAYLTNTFLIVIILRRHLYTASTYIYTQPIKKGVCVPSPIQSAADRCLGDITHVAGCQAD